jgi:hypothetical protein
VSNFKRYDPNRQGGRVPIRFVLEVAHVPDEKNGKSSTGKFKILSTIKKTWKVLVEGGTGVVIDNTKVRRTIMADGKVKEEEVAAPSLILQTGAIL